MAIGRISGPLLKENLLREGQNLRFENDLLVLKVDEEDPADHRIGIKTANPGYTLDIAGTTRSTTVRSGKLIIDDIDIDNSTISSTLGNLTLSAATGTDTIISKSNFLPELTDTYNLGTSDNRWLGGYFKDIFVNGISIGTGGGSVDLITDEIDKIYVQLNGSDTEGDGKNLASAYRTIKHALSQATNGQTVVLSPGIYEEEFPITVPQGVSVSGAGLRSTSIVPTALTNNKDCFLLNGETTVQELTVKDMFYDSVNDTGYAFRFAPGCVVNQRSPYVQRITVLNKGSVTSASDPYGFQQGDAGRGALLDGAVVSRASLEAAILFNECTFIVPNSRALKMTNGARTEWLNCFTYFADLAIEGVVGATGRGGDGKTYLELANVTGTFNAGDTISYYDADGVTVLASAVIESVSGSRIVLDGSVSGFKTNSNRTNKTLVANGAAQLSTLQKKFGATSLSLSTPPDHVFIQSTDDFAFGIGDFTVEGWFYKTSTPANSFLFEFRTSTTPNSPTFYTVNSDLIWFVNGAARITGTNALSNLNTWYHVAVSRNGTNTRMFVNGTQVGITWTDTTNYPQVPLYLGSRFSATLPWVGYIDEIRISKGISRYNANFSVPTEPFSSDIYTVLLSHFEGTPGSTSFLDDGITVQDIRSSSGGISTALVRYDRAEFAAELRSISGAFVYGNRGIQADGPDVVLQLMAHNFAYIGTGFDLTNNKVGVIQANEVIELNNGRVYYNSVDQEGNYRVGDLFVVDFDTGAVTFQNANFDVTTLNGITFTDGTSTTIVNPQGVETGNLVISGNTISTVSGQIILDPTGSQLVVVNSPMTVVEDSTFNNNLTVSGDIITSNANNISIGTPELGTLSGAVQMTTGTSLTDGVAQLNQVLTLLTPAAPTAFPGGQSLTVNSLTQRIMFSAPGSQTLNGNSISAPTAGTVVYVSRANTFGTSTITNTGPGTQGTVTVNRNNSSAVTKTLTYGNTTQVISSSITGTTLNSNIVSFTQPSTGVLVPGYLIVTGSSGTFGGLSPTATYYITAVTANTLALSTYNTSTGAIGSPFNATSTATGTLSFATLNDNGTITANNTSLILSNNVAYPVETPGFHETIDMNVIGTSVPAGWNTVQIAHSGASSTSIGATTTNTGIWYYDNTTPSAPAFSSQTFAIGTSSLTYSSTIPHYNNSTTYNIGFTLNWNPGQTGHSSTSSNVLTTSATGPWTSAGNKTYSTLGYTILPASTTVTAGSGPNASTFRVNVTAGFGAWTTTTTVPQYTADNSYLTAATSLPALNSVILYKTGTTSSTSFLDESNIFFSAAVGGSTSGATRCVNPDAGTANQDTPIFSAGSALFNSQTGTLYDTDAIVVGTGTGVNSLKHDRTNYSTGYLPAGPNLSSRLVGDSQYFTFRFVRSGVSKFSITYTTTTGIAAIFCAMPGTGGISGTTSTLNKWLDLRIDNSLADGCALGGNMNPSATGTRTYNCSFGTLSSTNATNNEIWVRVKLTNGQSLTSLYLGPSTV